MNSEPSDIISLWTSDEVPVKIIPYLDSGITNEDTNWDDPFWKTTKVWSEGNRAFIEAHTLKTRFHTCTFMQALLTLDGKLLEIGPEYLEKETYAGHSYEVILPKGKTLSVEKYGGYTVDLNHPAKDLARAAAAVLDTAVTSGFDALLEVQRKAWNEIWEMGDITIEGDIKAQQGIRFNILHLNQTYTGSRFTTQYWA